MKQFIKFPSSFLSKRISQPILLFLAVLPILYNYSISSGILIVDAQSVWHQVMMDGLAQAPYRYRILIPFAANYLKPLLFNSVFTAYLALDIMALLYFVFSLHAVLSVWFNETLSFLGVLIAVISIPAMFFNSGSYHPWSFWEPVFFNLAILATVNKKYILLIPLIALATLNRETGLFVALIYLSMSEGPLLPRLLRTVVLLVIWLMIFAGLRFVIGSAVELTPVEDALKINLSSEGLLRTAASMLSSCGLVMTMALLGFKNAPTAFQRSTVITFLPYAGLIFIFAIWSETRLWLSMYPILIPLALSALDLLPTGRLKLSANSDAPQA